MADMQFREYVGRHGPFYEATFWSRRGPCLAQVYHANPDDANTWTAKIECDGIDLFGEDFPTLAEALWSVYQWSIDNV